MGFLKEGCDRVFCAQVEQLADGYTALGGFGQTVLGACDH
jgi:hypothetical protein